MSHREVTSLLFVVDRTIAVSAKRLPLIKAFARGFATNFLPRNLPNKYLGICPIPT